MTLKNSLCLSEEGFHQISYKSWGDPHNTDIIICVHGLTRNGRDFDYLARQLHDQYYIVCPDLVGRGRSDWLRSGTHYHVPQYAQDLCALIARFDFERLTWIGTSLGGIIGMVLASMPGTPINRLILNDIGPYIEKESLQDLGAGLKDERSFNDLFELELFLKETYSMLGDLDEDHWRHMTRFDHRVNEDGTYSRNYDPAITENLKKAVRQRFDLWSYWELVQCPTMIIRGEKSPVLSIETCDKMMKNKDNCHLIQVPEVAHPASLVKDDEIDAIKQWLARTP